MVDIDSNDLTHRLNYIIVGIEVAKQAVTECENEALEEINREFLAATAEDVAELQKKPKKRTQRKKVKK